MMLALVAHPGFSSRLVTGVKVQIERHEQGAIWLEYCVYGAEALVLPTPAAPRRADELWKTTCFELFCTKPDREGYFEFNFSPSFEWAAYAFDGYRAGQKELPAQNPEIEISSQLGEHFFLAAEPWPPELVSDAAKLGLSAILEETDGTKSYWALAHPDPAKPDFHHPDCFTLQLPAADQA
jgi:hypothetical protein